MKNSLIIGLTILSVATGRAAEIHVATTGSDSSNGSKSAPFLTLAAARDAARDAARKFSRKEAVTVRVANGVYYLPETLVFSPNESGSEKISCSLSGIFRRCFFQRARREVVGSRKWLHPRDALTTLGRLSLPHHRQKA